MRTVLKASFQASIDALMLSWVMDEFFERGVGCTYELAKSVDYKR
jgi:hypothetical protein